MGSPLLPTWQAAAGGGGSPQVVTIDGSQIIVGPKSFTASNVAPAAGSKLSTDMLYLDAKEAIDGSDAFLRINQNGDFASGIYTPNPVRIDNTIDHRDSTGARTMTASLDLNDYTVSGGSNVRNVEYTSFTGEFQLHTGMGLRIYSAGDTANAFLEHDATDFNLTLTTGAVKIGSPNYVVIPGSPTTTGMVVRNLVTGTGLERVLTTSDTANIVGGTGITVTTGSPQFTITNSAPNVDQNLWLNMDADSGGPVAANTTTDTFTITGGTSITTAISGDAVTITNDAPNVDQNLWLNIAADVGGPVAANTTTDTLTIAGGNNVRTNIAGDTVTVNMTGSPFTGGAAGSPTSASTFTVVDESTDTTTFPVFVNAATGVNVPKTGSNLTFNSNTGLLTATSLGGTLTTAAQGNVTSLGTLTSLQVDNININTNTISSTAGTDLLITPLAGQQIILDNTIQIDAGVVTGATSITSTNFTTNDAYNMGDDFTHIQVTDSRTDNYSVDFMNDNQLANGIRWDFKDLGAMGSPGTGVPPSSAGTYGGVETFRPWSDDSGGLSFQTYYYQDTAGGTEPRISVRGGNIASSWGNWYTIPFANRAETISGDWTFTGAVEGTTNIVAGTGISIATGSPQYTITNDAPNVDQNLWLNIAADVGGPVAANTTTDTLTIAGGSRVRTNISGDTVTVNMTGSPVADGGTVTSIGITAGTLIDTAGTNPVTTSGNITVNVDLSEATEAVYAPGTDYVLFLDGGVAGTAAKESGVDFAAALAGTGITAASGVLSADTPTTITVADESADTTCFPLFVTAATGDLAPKTGTNMTFNSATGHFTATSKSFLIDHPTKPGKKLQYGSLEGPELGIYVRGKLRGSRVIELPDYWTELADPESITVNITPNNKHQNLYVEKIENNTVYVGGNTPQDIDCFYTVFAVRADVDRLVVEE
jgi:hypothetical protein